MSEQRQTGKTETVVVPVNRELAQNTLALTDSDAETFADLVAVALAEHEDRILYQEALRTWDEHDPDYVEGHPTLTAVLRGWTHCRHVVGERFRTDPEERRARSHLFEQQRRLRKYMGYRASRDGLSVHQDEAEQDQASNTSPDGYAVLRAMSGIPDSVDTEARSQSLVLASSGGEDCVR